MQYSALGIAGDPGAGKTELIKNLLKHPAIAHWKPCSTGDLLRQRHAKLTADGKFKDSFADYLAHGLTDSEILVLNDEARELVKKGNCLLDSRYVVENCKDTNSLLVFLTAHGGTIEADATQKKGATFTLILPE
jgi:cytidylate kinase